jgi:hypothetical protein
MKNNVKFFLVIIFLIIAIFTCCKNQKMDKPENEEKPLKYTEINLDKIKDSVILNLELIWDSSPKQDNNALHFPRDRDEYVQFLSCLLPGPDSCFYCLDVMLDKLIKYSVDGKYLETIGGSGSGPGEFLWPGWMYPYSNKYIYVYDKNNSRFQVFNINGKYIKDFKNIKQSGMSDYFGVTKNKDIITRADYTDSLLLIKYDSLGKFIKKFGLYPFPEYKSSLKRMTNRIIVLDNKKEDYIYCIFMDFPLIRKYDYEGRFIEEINIKGKFVDNYWDEHMEYVTDYKKANKKYNGKKLFVTSANLLKNGNIMMNIYGFKTIEVDLQGNIPIIIKKYILNGLNDSNPDLIGGLKYTIMNNKIYCCSGQRIYREVDRLTN